MNQSLELYNKDKRIWSITGYGPNLPNICTYDKDIYLSVRGSSWSWATWKDRWDVIDWDIKDFDIIKNDCKLQNQFNIGGDDLYKMLELQILGRIDSWAIRWVYNQFKLGMFTVYPKKSQVSNNGFIDGKGIHNNIKNNKWLVEINSDVINLSDIEVENEIIDKFRLFYNLSFSTKFGYFLNKYGMYKIVKYIYRLIKVRKNEKI
jgi:hypothetical protein